jgi:hypothetical protein
MFVGEQPVTRKTAPASRSSARRKTPRPRTGRRGHRSQGHLRYERRQTLQVGAARQAPHHKKPNELEIKACHQWLDRELALLRPALVVCLVRPPPALSSAAPRDRQESRAHHRRRAGEDSSRYRPARDRAPFVPVARAGEDRDEAYERFVADLKLIRPYTS